MNDDAEDGLLEANVPFACQVGIDAEMIVSNLDNNDGFILRFIVEMLESAGSSELREDLAERLRLWDEEHADS